jgi:hypothetical protein
MALEQAGVPSIAVHTHVFARLAKATALANGMPRTRQVFVPQPVVDRTQAELRGYIEGTDPISKRPFMQEVIEGLTKPLDEDDIKGATFERSTPRLLPPGSEDELQQLFHENHWTDYLPITLPTEERVAAMLKGTSHKPDEVVGKLRPTSFREFWEFTVEKVAVNAVMAGCRPEYLPVVLALAASGITAKSSSTTSMTALAVVNGPIRTELGMNCGIGALGPYSHANATIGRAYALLSQNLQGGSVPDESYMGSLGNGLAYAPCFAENEERSPWVPLHVQKGFKPTDSAVSVFFGARYMQEGYGPRDTWEERLRRQLAAGEHFPPLLVLDPITARLLAGRGINSKDELIQWCAANARLPAREFWDEQWVQTLIHPLAVAGVEPFATRLKAKPDEMVEVFEAEDINVVVTGGETQGAYRIFGARYNKTVSIDSWR